MAAPDAACPCADILGSWQCEKAKDVDFVQFLKDLGIGMIKRNLAGSMQPLAVFTWENNQVVVAAGGGDNAAKNALTVDGATGNRLETPIFNGEGVANAPTSGKLVVDCQPDGKAFQVRITREVKQIDGADYIEQTMEILTNGAVTSSGKRFFKKQ